MKKKNNYPVWFNGKDINETVFCEEFMKSHLLAYDNNAFFSPNGRLTDLLPLSREIYRILKTCAVKNVPHTIKNVIELLKLYNKEVDLKPRTDRIHLANGTLFTDGRFEKGKREIVRNRLPVPYDPDAPRPEKWLSFLNDLLYGDLLIAPGLRINPWIRIINAVHSLG